MKIGKTVWLSCFVGALALNLTLPRTAEACSRIGVSGLEPFTPMPASGSQVPRTARVWIPLEEYGWEGSEDPTFELVDGAGAPVPFSSSTITVQSELVFHMVVLTPSELLTPGVVYEARTRGGTVITRFTATNEEDRTAPQVDHVAAFGDPGKRSNSVRCGEATTAWLHVQPQPEITFMVGPEAVAALPSAVFAVSSTGKDPMTGGVTNGSHSFRAVAVDVSGNFAASNVVEVEISEASKLGCTAAGGTPLLLWTLAPVFGALILRSRRPGARRFRV